MVTLTGQTSILSILETVDDLRVTKTVIAITVLQV